MGSFAPWPTPIAQKGFANTIASPRAESAGQGIFLQAWHIIKATPQPSPSDLFICPATPLLEVCLEAMKALDGVHSVRRASTPSSSC